MESGEEGGTKKLEDAVEEVEEEVHYEAVKESGKGYHMACRESCIVRLG